MKGLNLANMKKISHDDKVATFRHPEGHEIRVAINKLHPKLKKELDQIPVHRFEGSEREEKSEPRSLQEIVDKNALRTEANVPDYSTPFSLGQQFQNLLPTSPNLYDDSQKNYGAEAQSMSGLGKAPQEPAPAAPPANPPALDQSSPAPAPSTPEAAAPAAEAAQNVPRGTSAPQEVWPNHPPPQAPPEDPQSPDAISRRVAQEAADWSNDVKRGKIDHKMVFNTPDSTLGRIATFFGLLVSGAGAGLSHQPNALLEMMNKELDRDQAAKIKGKENALDLFKNRQMNELRKAQIERYGVENKLTAQQIKGMDLKFQIESQERDRLLKMRSAVHSLVDKFGKDPKAQAQLAALSQMVDLNTANIADVVKSKAAYIDMLYNPPGSSENLDERSQRNRMLPALGPEGVRQQQYNESHQVPGIPGETSRALDKGDFDKLRGMENFDIAVKDFRDWAKTHSDPKSLLDPRVRAYGMTKLRNVQSKYREGQGMGALKGYDIPILNEELPAKPVSAFNKYINDPKLQSAEENNIADYNNHLTSVGLKPPSATATRATAGRATSAAKPAQSKEIRYDDKGDPWKMGPNGKSVRVK